MKIKESTRFSKELKQFGLSSNLLEVLYLLSNNKPLPKKYLDHQLKGNLSDYRECHIEPNLLLLYRYKNQTLELYRLNSHSEIFE